MNKNSMRLLVAVGLIVLVALSWYTMLGDAKEAEDAYMSQLTTAREKANSGLYAVALEYYEQARVQRDSVQLRDEMAQIYQDHADSLSYEAFCEDMIADFPLELPGYERLVTFYRDTQAYDSCFNTIETVRKRGLQSETVEAVAAELAYAYNLSRTAAREVQSFSSGYCAVLYKSGKWSYVNTRGSSVASGYAKAAPFSSSGYAPVQLETGRYALIDTTGKQVALSPEGLAIEDCLALLSGKMAVKYDGKYRYFNAKFEEQFGSFDYAGSFYGGVAAVMDGGKWAIIDETGKNVTDFVFEDIKLDDKGIAFRNDRALAKQDGSYILIDTKGKRIGQESWQDADAFNSDMLAAVCKDGKWGFIDGGGKTVVDYTYAAAGSFAGGMAAVQVGDVWGYICAEDYSMKIEPQFAAAKDFSSGGTAFVQEGSDWRLLRIYRLT